GWALRKGIWTGGERCSVTAGPVVTEEESMGVGQSRDIDAKEAGWVEICCAAQVHDIGIVRIHRHANVVVALAGNGSKEIVVCIGWIIGWNGVRQLAGHAVDSRQMHLGPVLPEILRQVKPIPVTAWRDDKRV